MTSNAWSDPAQLRALLIRLDYMFPFQGAEGRRAYLFFKGWTPTFSTACERIDVLLGSDKRNFHWVRIREKFGAPSLAYRMEGEARFAVHAHRPTSVTRVPCAAIENFEPIAVEIHELILQLELDLRNLCIVCGARSTITDAQGPWSSLCPGHQAADFPSGPRDAAGPVWMAARLDQDAEQEGQ